MSVSIATTVSSYPKLPYTKIADAVLGEHYDLSVVFHGATRACHLNQRTRNKSYVPNVLSFPLTNTAGEIYLTPIVIKRQASRVGVPYPIYTGYLFIHGLLHLKGYDHGTKMERLEKQYVAQFFDNAVHSTKIFAADQ